MTTAPPTSGRDDPTARGDEFNQAQFEGEPTDGGSITIGVWGRPGRLEPTGSLTEAAQVGPSLAIYDPLIARDPEGGFVPSLATGWSASDDLTTYTLRLREGSCSTTARRSTAPPSSRIHVPEGPRRPVRLRTTGGGHRLGRRTRPDHGRST